MNPVTHVYKPRKRRRSPLHEANEDPQAMKDEEDRGRQPGAEGGGAQPESGPSVGDGFYPPSHVCNCVHKFHVVSYGVVTTVDHVFVQYVDA